MKLITVEAAFAASDLDTATKMISDQAPAVLAMPGCQHYALYRKPAGDGIAIIQHWDGMEAFEAYRASEAFSALGAGLSPLMALPPRTTVAKIDTI